MSTSDIFTASEAIMDINIQISAQEFNSGVRKIMMSPGMLETTHNVNSHYPIKMITNKFSSNICT